MKIKEGIKSIAIALVIAAAVTTLVKPTVVQGKSMQPTLYENNYLLVSRQAYQFGDEKRGDIVVVHSDLEDKNGRKKLIIKRIIGLPGDTISIRDGNVFLNGKKFSEDYILEEETQGNIKECTVPEGKFFVMGDNRRVSIDSRSPEVGCIDEDSIAGKAFLRLYPFDSIGSID